MPPMWKRLLADSNVTEGFAGSADPMINCPAGISTNSKVPPPPRSSDFVAGRCVRAAYSATVSRPSHNGQASADSPACCARAPSSAARHMNRRNLDRTRHAPSFNTERVACKDRMQTQICRMRSIPARETFLLKFPIFFEQNPALDRLTIVLIKMSKTKTTSKAQPLNVQ